MKEEEKGDLKKEGKKRYSGEEQRKRKKKLKHPFFRFRYQPRKQKTTTKEKKDSIYSESNFKIKTTLKSIFIRHY